TPPNRRNQRRLQGRYAHHPGRHRFSVARSRDGEISGRRGRTRCQPAGQWSRQGPCHGPPFRQYRERRTGSRKRRRHRRLDEDWRGGGTGRGARAHGANRPPAFAEAGDGHAGTVSGSTELLLGSLDSSGSRRAGARRSYRGSWSQCVENRRPILRASAKVISDWWGCAAAQPHTTGRSCSHQSEMTLADALIQSVPLNADYGLLAYSPSLSFCSASAIRSWLDCASGWRASAWRAASIADFHFSSCAAHNAIPFQAPKWFGFISTTSLQAW